MSQILSREQIEGLPEHEVEPAYEQAKQYFNGLLSKVEADNRKKIAFQEEIQAARLQYVMLRLRKYPVHFSKLNLAAMANQ